MEIFGPQADVRSGLEFVESAEVLPLVFELSNSWLGKGHRFSTSH